MCKGRVGRLRAGGWRQEATILGFARGCRGTDLPNYLNEFQFRWNTRKMDDGQRVARAIKQIDGKRIEYRESVENPPYLPKPQAQMEALLNNE